MVYTQVLNKNVQNSGGGQGGTRTPEGVSQQIYSLPRLTTSVPTQFTTKMEPPVGFEPTTDRLQGGCSTS